MWKSSRGGLIPKIDLVAREDDSRIRGRIVHYGNQVDEVLGDDKYDTLQKAKAARARYMGYLMYKARIIIKEEKHG